MRLFEGVEIGALDVFDDGDFQRLAIAGFDNEDRHFVQAGALGGAPAALAGDDLVGVGDARDRPHEDGLDDAALADRGGELVEFVVGEGFARIARVGAQEFDRRLASAAARAAGVGSWPASPSRAAKPRPRRGRWSSVAGGVVGHRKLLGTGGGRRQAARQRSSR